MAKIDTLTRLDVRRVDTTRVDTDLRAAAAGLLRRAKEVIASRHGFEFPAENALGEAVLPYSREAVTWTACGAIWLAAHESGLDDDARFARDTVDAFDVAWSCANLVAHRAAPTLETPGLEGYEDQYTHSELLAVFDKAIALLEPAELR